MMKKQVSTSEKSIEQQKMEFNSFERISFKFLVITLALLFLFYSVDAILTQ